MHLSRCLRVRPGLLPLLLAAAAALVLLARPPVAGAATRPSASAGGRCRAAAWRRATTAPPSRARLCRQRLAEGETRRRWRARHRGGGASPERPLPQRLLRHQPQALLWLHEVGRRRHRSRVSPCRGGFAPRSRAAAGSHASLVVNGVVGEADLWFNGHEVAGHRTLQGAFTQYVYDVSRPLLRGANAVALRLYPNDPGTMFTLDNVDWTQIPPDNNTGIQFPVQLHTSAALAISDAHVVEHNAPHVASSALTLRAQVTNTTGRSAARRAQRAASRPHPVRPIADHPAGEPPGPLHPDGVAQPRAVSRTDASTTPRCGGRIRWARSRSTA